MNYIKSFKKKKSNKFNVFIGITSVVIVVLLFIMTSNNKTLNSKEINNQVGTEDIIENASKYVVGISRASNTITEENYVWGSGVIISRKGYIVTNAHVSGEKNSICNVIVDDKNSYKGVVVWSNNSLDLAIVKINAKLNSCIDIIQNNQVKIGQEIFCIGNPISKSFQKTVSKGIISGTNRSLEFEENENRYYMNNLIQTDAAINYGSSGGALIDGSGKLIGINTIKITDAELMSFAIRADIISPIIEKLNESGNFDECGLKIWCYDKYSMRESNIAKKIDDGVLVAKIEENSYAEKAGLRAGDIIKYIDTDKINTIVDLKKIIFKKNVGDKIILKIDRNKKEMLINVELEKIE